MDQASTVVDLLVARLLKLRNRHFFLFDILILLFTPAAALMLRLERWTVPPAYVASLVVVTGVFLALKVVVFRKAGLYNRYWKYASIDELAKITGAVVGAVALQGLLFFL